MPHRRHAWSLTAFLLRSKTSELDMKRPLRDNSRFDEAWQKPADDGWSVDDAAWDRPSPLDK